MVIKFSPDKIVLRHSKRSISIQAPFKIVADGCSYWWWRMLVFTLRVYRIGFGLSFWFDQTFIDVPIPIAVVLIWKDTHSLYYRPTPFEKIGCSLKLRLLVRTDIEADVCGAPLFLSNPHSFHRNRQRVASIKVGAHGLAKKKHLCACLVRTMLGSRI